MRLWMLTGLAFAMSAGSAFAQSTITVIGDDGKVQTLEIPGAEVPEEQQAEPAPAPESAPQPAPKKKAPPKPPEPEELKDFIQPKQPAASKGQGQVVDSLPEESKPLEKAIEKAPENKSEKKTSKKSGKKSKKKKEQQAEVAPVPEAPKQAAPVIAPGTVITEELAASIALDRAPPSSSYKVAKRTFQGKDVFLVTFKTETGPFDVLVDSTTGEVILDKPVIKSQGAPKPGHLPPIQ